MLLFAISFFTVSVISGIDMLSALSFGMRYGYKKALFLILGQLSALAVIVAFSVVFAGAILNSAPKFIAFFKLVGAVYLLYTGLGMLAQGKAAHARSATQETRAQR
ncbi:MAG: LysE family transporter [Helicobacteraceae bacterium]